LYRNRKKAIKVGLSYESPKKNLRKAELIGELLEFVSIKAIVVPENVIVAGPRGSLDT
jgi:hypothetical protein